MSSLVIYGFTAGAVATVNPRGFALLPAWFAREMAAHEDRPATERLIRGTVSGGLVSLGFVSIFVVAGALLAAGSEWLGPALPWIGVILGTTLALISIGWIASIRLPGLPVVETCRRVSTRYGAFGFGLSYGLASISCTLPVFMSVAGLSFLLESEISLTGFLAYLAGATAVLTLVAVGGTLFGSPIKSARSTRPSSQPPKAKRPSFWTGFIAINRVSQLKSIMWILAARRITSLPCVISRDSASRRVYGTSRITNCISCTAPFLGGSIHEILRLATSVKAGTTTASAILKSLSA